MARYDLSGRSFLDDVGAAADAGTHVILDFPDAVSDAVDFYADGDGALSTGLGTALTPLDMLANLPSNPGRIRDYFKGCNRAEIGAGALALEGGIATGLVAGSHVVEAAAAARLAQMFGQGSSAIGASVGGGAAVFGLGLLRNAC